MGKEIAISNKEKTQVAMMVAAGASQNKMMLAVQTPRVAESSDKTIVSFLSPAIEKARVDLGLRTDTIKTEDNRLFIDAVLQDIKLNFATLSIGEIPEVIYRFTRGKYTPPDKQIFLNVVNVFNAFKAYMLDPDRHKAKSELLMLEEPEKPESKVTAEEIEKRRLGMIVNAYAIFKDTGKFDDAGNYVYTSIELYQKIPFAKERKEQIYFQAKEKLRTENKKAGRNIAERKEKQFFNYVLDLKKEDEVKEIDKARVQEGLNKIIVEAKKIALLQFFADLKEFETDILEFLNLNENE